MIRLTCSVSLASIAAIIDWIDFVTSLPMTSLLASACWASVSTAASTALLASSLRGLNSFCSSDEKSLPAYATSFNALCSSASAMVGYSS